MFHIFPPKKKVILLNVLYDSYIISFGKDLFKKITQQNFIIFLKFTKKGLDK